MSREYIQLSRLGREFKAPACNGTDRQICGQPGVQGLLRINGCLMGLPPSLILNTKCSFILCPCLSRIQKLFSWAPRTSKSTHCRHCMMQHVKVGYKSAPCS